MAFVEMAGVFSNKRGQISSIIEVTSLDCRTTSAALSSFGFMLSRIRNRFDFTSEELSADLQSRPLASPAVGDGPVGRPADWPRIQLGPKPPSGLAGRPPSRRPACAQPSSRPSEATKYKKIQKNKKNIFSLKNV